MSIPHETYAAFSDEMVKIAVFKHLGGWLRRGWRDLEVLGGDISKKTVRGRGWLGREGTWRQNLPIGPKSLLVGLTAATAPSVVGKEDPLRMSRSRAERATGFGAEILGGLTGAGAALSLPGKKFLLGRSILGGVGGSLLGGRLATTPWRMSRAKAQQPVLPAGQRRELLQQAVG